MPEGGRELREAYLYDAVRTPRGAGKPTGALAGVKPVELLAGLFHALEERSGLDTSTVGDVVLGCNTAVGDQGANIAKVAALYSGWSDSIPGSTTNRFCASGLDALGHVAMQVMVGREDLVVAGGVESMSRVPLLSDNGAWFADPDVAQRTGFVHMGIAGDLVATRGKFDREQCDAYAAASHARAAAARDGGRFERSLVPVLDEAGTTLLDHDEWIRDTITANDLAALPAAFAELGAAGGDDLALATYPELGAINHVHTVGTSPGMVDAASLLLVGSREAGQRLGREPRARIAAVAHVSVEPVLMLTGPAPATHKALDYAGMAVDDVDIFECNESFAATVLEFERALDLDPATVNVNGGAISMGHPLGASGGILVATVLDELERRDKSVGVVAIPAGAGLATAAVVERA